MKIRVILVDLIVQAPLPFGPSFDNENVVILSLGAGRAPFSWEVLGPPLRRNG